MTITKALANQANIQTLADPSLYPATLTTELIVEKLKLLEHLLDKFSKGGTPQTSVDSTVIASSTPSHPVVTINSLNQAAQQEANIIQHLAQEFKQTKNKNAPTLKSEHIASIYDILFEPAEIPNSDDIPYRELARYSNKKTSTIESTRWSMLSRLFAVGASLTAMIDAGTYALGYGGVIIPAFTVTMVAIYIATPLALLGAFIRALEYKHLRSEMEYLIEKERENYRITLSNEIVNIKRLNATLKIILNSHHKGRNLNKDLSSLLENINAAKMRLQHFKAQRNDNSTIIIAKDDIRKVYALGEKAAELELARAECYLHLIYKTTSIDPKNLKPAPLTQAAPIHIKKDSTLEKAWKFIVPFVYALGTAITICLFSASFAAMIINPIGAAALIVTACVLAFGYKKIEDKFTKLHTSLFYLKAHAQQQTEQNLTRSNIKNICENIQDKYITNNETKNHPQLNAEEKQTTTASSTPKTAELQPQNYALNRHRHFQHKEEQNLSCSPSTLTQAITPQNNIPRAQDDVSPPFAPQPDAKPFQHL